MKFEIPYHKKDKERLVQQLLSDKESFEEMISEYLQGNIHERFGWTLSSAIETRPSLGTPWVRSLIEKLRSTDADDTRRNISRTLQFLEIPEDLVPKILDICYGILGSAEEKTAARVFSMTIIFNQVKRYPDLGREFLDTLTLLYPMGSAGFKSRSKKIIQNLSKK